MNGSRITPSPNGSAARTSCRMKACGLSDGCGAIFRSSRRAGADWITSTNGFLPETRRKPPAPHLRRLSCTRPSHGFRNKPHGSHAERGITDTSENSSCAFLGRSPPRNVCTRRIISPRFSNPAAIKDMYTYCDNSGLVAIITWPPGTRTRTACLANFVKKEQSVAMSVSSKIVNLGTGLRLQPSNDGGMRQTPPRPLRSFAFSMSVYSLSP